MNELVASFLPNIKQVLDAKVELKTMTVSNFGTRYQALSRAHAQWKLLDWFNNIQNKPNPSFQEVESKFLTLKKNLIQSFIPSSGIAPQAFEKIFKWFEEKSIQFSQPVSLLRVSIMMYLDPQLEPLFWRLFKSEEYQSFSLFFVQTDLEFSPLTLKPTKPTCTVYSQSIDEKKRPQYLESPQNRFIIARYNFSYNARKQIAESPLILLHCSNPTIMKERDLLWFAEINETMSYDWMIRIVKEPFEQRIPPIEGFLAMNFLYDESDVLPQYAKLTVCTNPLTCYQFVRSEKKEFTTRRTQTRATSIWSVIETKNQIPAEITSVYFEKKESMPLWIRFPIGQTYQVDLLQQSRSPASFAMNSISFNDEKKREAHLKSLGFMRLNPMHYVAMVKVPLNPPAVFDGLTLYKPGDRVDIHGYWFAKKQNTGTKPGFQKEEWEQENPQKELVFLNARTYNGYEDAYSFFPFLPEMSDYASYQCYRVIIDTYPPYKYEKKMQSAEGQYSESRIFASYHANEKSSLSKLNGKVEYISAGGGCVYSAINSSSNGSFNVNTAKLIADCWNVDFLDIDEDASEVICDDQPISLAFLNALKEEIPWYSRFGFVPMKYAAQILYVRLFRQTPVVILFAMGLLNEYEQQIDPNYTLIGQFAKALNVSVFQMTMSQLISFYSKQPQPIQCRFFRLIYSVFNQQVQKNQPRTLLKELMTRKELYFGNESKQVELAIEKINSHVKEERELYTGMLVWFRRDLNVAKRELLKSTLKTATIRSVPVYRQSLPVAILPEVQQSNDLTKKVFL